MSFYVDPWLYNCEGGAPEDTPEQAQDQEMIIETMQRRWTTRTARASRWSAAAGNKHLDMANPGTDRPARTTRPARRTRARSTTTRASSLPSRGTARPRRDGAGSVGAARPTTPTGPPSRAPARSSCPAPGGWFRDGFGTPSLPHQREPDPLDVPAEVRCRRPGSVDQNGNITPAGEAAGVIKQCQDERRRRAPARAATTPSCRAPRWPARTPPGSRLSRIGARARAQGRSRLRDTAPTPCAACCCGPRPTTPARTRRRAGLHRRGPRRGATRPRCDGDAATQRVLRRGHRQRLGAVR